MAGDGFTNDSWMEEELQRRVRAAWRRARLKGQKWARLRPIFEDGETFGLEIPVPTEEEEAESVQLGPAATSTRFDGDTEERMEKAEACREAKDEEGTDEVPALSTTPTEDLILDALRKADSPLKLTQIAIRSGHKNDAHFGKSMTSLVKKKGMVLALKDNRYWLASQPLPAER